VPPPKRYAQADEPIYKPSDYAERWQQARAQCPQGVRLSADEQEAVLTAIVDQINQLALMPVILAVGAWHVHLVAQFGALAIRPTVGRLKSFATRALPNPGNRKRVWADGCHMKSLPSETALSHAINYVRRHEAEGAVVREWVR
jgi:hypothetical protein